MLAGMLLIFSSRITRRYKTLNKFGKQTINLKCYYDISCVLNYLINCINICSKSYGSCSIFLLPLAGKHAQGVFWTLATRSIKFVIDDGIDKVIAMINKKIDKMFPLGSLFGFPGVPGTRLSVSIPVISQGHFAN